MRPGAWICLFLTIIPFLALSTVTASQLTAQNNPCSGGRLCTRQTDGSYSCLPESRYNGGSGYEYCCADTCKFDSSGLGKCKFNTAGDTTPCSIPWETTYDGRICKDDHVCGFHGQSYSWCRTKDGGWGHCCIGECSKLDGYGGRVGCRISTTSLQPCKTQSIVIPFDCPFCKEARIREKRAGVVYKFAKRHLANKEEWTRIQNIRNMNNVEEKSKAIQNFIRRKTEENERLEKKYNTFIRDEDFSLLNRQCTPGREDFTIPNREVVTFERKKNNNRITFEVNGEMSGTRDVYVYVDKMSGKFYHLHRCN